MTDTELQQLIKDTAYAVANSTNKEHSNLIGELRIQNAQIMSGVDFLKNESVAINEHLARLNGSVAKHEQRLNNQDIMNAQTTISQQQTAVSLNKLVESDEKNTTDRIGRKAVMVTAQWILGFIGLGTFALVAKYIFNAF